ncbi:NUDIX hydrolase [Cellulosimicrobium cellulans]|uniref:NUDIX hydrolase n=1 Tax=Cellulosimicrobium funkei TaxID=264251 RepID=A0A0H2KYN4_9MICO|nr:MULTISPECIES: NUDIX domain-containing protein [Cellulosimicrobium]KLN33052.1 NUDIX hydrolase [Cellulosimicrobium funkei]KZM78097.1 NUDIX hydrolase [Cellulosimicrobium sp. I38E]
MAEAAGAPSSLGPDWVLGDDGLYFRRGARVLLLDDADRILLARGHDVDQPERSWWFTIGGGVDPGESDRDAALREVREETGILLDPGALVGPVYTRSAIFDFYRQHCRQDEVLFLARVDDASGDGGDAGTLSRDGWTDVELDVVDEMRWWSLDDLRGVEIEVFPEGLPDLVTPLLGGWDGVTHHLGIARED